ncbi:hypothetical protein MLD38_030784 [Melastoma candidum]|uniref:Uncharacterized protein n=1 Tax=Melastoma candidum TaxID=119954 RepID=A0ACB9MM61_9MYRT|nr:hypothetical protein MLD38_030784 [Melastoma candidum]
MINALLRFVFVVLPMAVTTLVMMLKQPFVPSCLHHGRGEANAAFFIFGDSLLDAGNNIHLNNSMKANHWPYGETFFHYPAGRICDGRIPPDFIAEYAGLPFIKPYLQPNFTDYTGGANFASAGAGVLHQTSPDVVLLFPSIHDRKCTSWAGRKFSFQNVAPIGCNPSMRYEMRIDGYWEDSNVLAHTHNVALSRLLPELEKELVGFKYVLFDYYTMLLERIFNNSEYGFEVGKSACCWSRAYNGNFTCGIRGENFMLCPYPNVFVFFDPAHPTEAANRELSWLMWSGEPPVMRPPRNLKSLFEVSSD